MKNAAESISSTAEQLEVRKILLENRDFEITQSEENKEKQWREEKKDYMIYKI